MTGPAPLPIGQISLYPSWNPLMGSPGRMSKRRRLPFGDSPKFRAMLERPTWSVKKLLPEEYRRTKRRRLEEKLSGKATDSNAKIEQAKATEAEDIVSPEKLRHLLRLSALPPPKNAEEESQMLKDLRHQIHFVKQIQKVDATDVEPLVAIRDETPECVEESTIKLADLQPYLDREERVGRGEFSKTRRVRDDWVDEMTWDPFQMGVGSDANSGRRQGRYFVVKKAKRPKKAR